jgi:predicted urease superfamily metal-dependent hydrolase
MTREQAAKVARDLAYSLGARMYVVRRSSHDYLVLPQASADAAEIYDPTLTANSASHGCFTIAAAAKP